MRTHAELLRDTEKLLSSEGFEVYESFGLKRVFDYIASRDYKLFLKVLVNIDNLNRYDAGELAKFSNAFSSSAFVVGERAGSAYLEDHLIYERFGNYCLNLETLEDVISNGMPSRFTKRGQKLVRINGDALRSFRERNSITASEMAARLDTVVQTIYRCEEKNQITEDLFDRFVREFSYPDIKKPLESRRILPGQAELTDPLKKFVVGLLRELDVDIKTLHSTDFALDDQPVLTPVSKTESEFRRKQRIAKNLEEALGCGLLHITKQKHRGRIPGVTIKELAKMQDKNELFEELS